jgi:hypothetical protein
MYIVHNPLEQIYAILKARLQLTIFLQVKDLKIKYSKYNMQNKSDRFSLNKLSFQNVMINPVVIAVDTQFLNYIRKSIPLILEILYFEKKATFPLF